MLRRLCHWLLVVSLMLNGIGSATAGVTMHAGSLHAAQDVIAAQLAASDHAQHGHHTATGPAAIPESADHHGDCGDDCCGDADSCQSLCMHQALQLPLPALPPLAATGLVASPVTLRIPTPPLGEDIRPPIR